LVFEFFCVENFNISENNMISVEAALVLWYFIGIMIKMPKFSWSILKLLIFFENLYNIYIYLWLLFKK
jgi:hypothetical protein